MRSPAENAAYRAQLPWCLALLGTGCAHMPWHHPPPPPPAPVHELEVTGAGTYPAVLEAQHPVAGL